MTPSELNKIKAATASAVAALLARESNEDSTAESLAEEIAEAMIESMIDTYEAIQAKSYNLVVVASFALPEGDTYTAAVGPLSTRAKQRARDVGARFAWDYKTRTGSGRFSVLPLIRDPSEAWDEARAAAADLVSDSIPTGPVLSANPFGPACICGLPEHPRYNSLGDLADLVCPLHPEESNGSQA